MTKTPKIAKAQGLITFEQLRAEITYDPETGIVRRLVDRSSNARAGDFAGYIHSGCGRMYVCLLGRTYLLHRVAFFYMTGHWPSQMTDHINGDPTDNRWCNLREATPRQNCANSRRRKDNTIGHKCIRKMNDRWQVRLGTGGVIHIGTYDSLSEAISHRDAAISKHFGEYGRRE